MKFHKWSIMILLILLLSACSTLGERNKVHRVVPKILHKKYGEDFVVNGMALKWAGQGDQSTLEVSASPVNNPKLDIKVEINKNLKTLNDDYLNYIVAQNERPMLQSIADEFWNRVHLAVDISTGVTLLDSNDKTLLFRDVKNMYSNANMYISLYLNIDDLPKGEEGDLDQDAEMERFKAFAEKLNNPNYTKSSVLVLYLSSEAYSRIDEAIASTDISHYYDNDEFKTQKVNIRTVVGFDITEDGDVSSIEETRDHFSAWKNTRLGIEE